MIHPMATAGFAFQTLVFGTAGVWLLAPVPAATVTALKGRWALFFVGWLTFGLAWFVGAVALAPADSRWARKFYRGERALRAAVGSSVDVMTSDRCLQLDGNVWHCRRWDDLASRAVEYRVVVRRSGCWTGRVDEAKVGRRKPISGCITIVDHILG
jgi:hypothetical protein